MESTFICCHRAGDRLLENCIKLNNVNGSLHWQLRNANAIQYTARSRAFQRPTPICVATDFHATSPPNSAHVWLILILSSSFKSRKRLMNFTIQVIDVPYEQTNRIISYCWRIACTFAPFSRIRQLGSPFIYFEIETVSTFRVKLRSIQINSSDFQQWQRSQLNAR